MLFRQLFEPVTSTYTYLVADEASRQAVLIDPVVEEVERYVALLNDLQLKLVYTLETHVHADHVTGADWLRRTLGSRSVVHSHAGAACADLLVDSGDELRLGELLIQVLYTPGHTNGDVSYLVGDRVFTGDALLIGGCGRTDFQQGSAERLYASVHNHLFSLPGDTLVYPGHDYKGRTVSTIAEERAINARLGGGKSLDDFVTLMSQLNLPMPRNLARAVPANQQCGREVAAPQANA